MAESIYALCAVTSAASAFMLFRLSMNQRGSLGLLWTAVSVTGLASSNFLLLIDRVVYPGGNTAVRTALAASATVIMTVGLIWDRR